MLEFLDSGAKAASKKVITGHSSRENGFLVITDRPLSEVAAAFDAIVHEVDGQILFGPDRKLSEDELQTIADSDLPRDFYSVYVTDYREDVNLNQVVCW